MRELDYVHMLLERRVEGMVFISSEITDVRGEHSHYAQLLEQGARLVFVNGGAESLPVTSVGVDERASGRIATEYLLELGHRRIGFVAGDEFSLPTREKARGREDALRAAGLDASRDVAHGDFTVDGGRRTLHSLVHDANGDRPTAVICSNDPMAIGALQEAAALGLRRGTRIALPRCERGSHRVEVVEGLVRDPTFVEPDGEAPARETALRGERHTAVGDAVADVCEPGETVNRPALAALAADGTDRPLGERGPPALGGGVDVVRDEADLDPLAAEDGVDQLVEAGRHDQRVVLRDQLAEPGAHAHVFEEEPDDVLAGRADRRHLGSDHLVERQGSPQFVLQPVEDLEIAEPLDRHVQRVPLRHRPVPVEDQRERLGVIRHKRRQAAGSDQPPSITSVCPRIISASAEERNATTPATSSGVTSRPAGFPAPEASISSRFGKCSSALVSTTPAETAFTRMPRGASSTAR
jgi:hypothetical protein